MLLDHRFQIVDYFEGVHSEETQETHKKITRIAKLNHTCKISKKMLPKTNIIIKSISKPLSAEPTRFNNFIFQEWKKYGNFTNNFIGFSLKLFLLMEQTFSKIKHTRVCQIWRVRVFRYKFVK